MKRIRAGELNNKIKRPQNIKIAVAETGNVGNNFIKAMLKLANMGKKELKCC